MIGEGYWERLERERKRYGVRMIENAVLFTKNLFCEQDGMAAFNFIDQMTSSQQT